LYRRQKIGTHIITLLEKIAYNNNVQLIHLSSNIQSIPFYQILGYTPVGDPFIECGDTAQKMVKKLNHKSCFNTDSGEHSLQALGHMYVLVKSQISCIIAE
jgi:hypothetical protein